MSLGVKAKILTTAYKAPNICPSPEPSLSGPTAAARLSAPRDSRTSLLLFRQHTTERRASGLFFALCLERCFHK